MFYSDNGPQFNCHSFQEFAEKWAFQHITSSPRYAQSNGFVERAVQTVKQVIKKALQERMDPDLALLCLRTTPVSEKIKSPMEMLMGRKAKANLPVCVRNYNVDREAINAALEERQLSQKHYYDQRAGPELPTLHTGQEVRVQSHQDGRWLPATVESNCTEPRSYVVRMENGGQLRRNRRQLHVEGGRSRYGRVYKPVDKFGH